MDSAIKEEQIRKKAARDGVTHFCTGIAVVEDGKALVVRRAAHDHLGGVWELPGGGVDEGETFEQSAIREMLEETGLQVEIIATAPGFDYQTPRKPKVRQINFIAQAAPGEVKLDPEEHDDFRWISREEIDSLGFTDEIKASLRHVLVKK